MGASASKAAGEATLTAREVIARRKVAADVQLAERAVKSNAAFPKVTNPTNIDLFIKPDGGKVGKEEQYDMPIAQLILSQIEKWAFVRVTTASGKAMTRKEDMAKWARIQEEKAMDEKFGKSVHKVDNRVSEKQLVEMLTRLRDLKGYSADEASKDYGLSKDIVQMLVRTASLPEAQVDEDFDQVELNKSKKLTKG